MNAKWGRFALIFLLLALLSGVVWASTATAEQEPNDTPAQANDLGNYAAWGPMQGAVNPAGDVDYFKVRGVNVYWGMVAFLDTADSTASKRGVLTAYAPDGVTVLQQADAAPGRQGVIAWQHFTGNQPHFLRVSEAGDDESISQYRLRYYELAMGGLPGAEQEEQEPNDSPAAANTSARVNRGVIDRVDDRDCYAVYAEEGERLIYVLNADPDGEGGADFKLSLYRPDGSLWHSADRAGAGGNEYIDEVTIPEDGVYAYCVEAQSGAGADAAYLAGPIVDARGYAPAFDFAIHWDNPRPGNLARVGDEMRYTVTFSYTEPLPIPDEFRLNIFYPADCQEVVDAGEPDYVTGSNFGWRYDGLAPDTHIVKHFVLRAKARCTSYVSLNAIMAYYDTGWGFSSYYTIGDGYYLPLVMR